MAGDGANCNRSGPLETSVCNRLTSCILQKIPIMKLFILIAILPLVTAFNYANREGQAFDSIAERITTNIESYSVASPEGRKVNDIEIWQNGEVKLFYSGNQQFLFNLFELYKTQECSLGVQYLPESRSIQLLISGVNTASIYFGSHEKALSVYNDLLALIMEGKDEYTPEMNLDINRTVDSLNQLLLQYDGNGTQVKVNMKGTVIITNRNMQFFVFNLQELQSDEYSSGFEVNGIELVPCTKRNVAAQNFINFNTAKGTVALIRFDCIDDSELARIHQLLIHLRATMMKVMYS